MIFSETGRCAMSIPPRLKPESGSGQSFRHSTGRNARILIVEDDYLVGTFTEATLLEAGHDIIGLVTTGEEAVLQGTLSWPDLVLMDIRLAGQMTGIEAAVELRAQGIPTLFASAHSDPGTRVSGDEAKPEGWLAKPYSASEVVSAVEIAIARLRRH